MEFSAIVFFYLLINGLKANDFFFYADINLKYCGRDLVWSLNIFIYPMIVAFFFLNFVPQVKNWCMQKIRKDVLKTSVKFRGKGSKGNSHKDMPEMNWRIQEKSTKGALCSKKIPLRTSQSRIKQCVPCQCGKKGS